MMIHIHIHTPTHTQDFSFDDPSYCSLFFFYFLFVCVCVCVLVYVCECVCNFFASFQRESREGILFFFPNTYDFSVNRFSFLTLRGDDDDAFMTNVRSQ